MGIETGLETYERYWHHNSCETAEESISPLVIQSFVHLRSKQWESGCRQIPCQAKRRIKFLSRDRKIEFTGKALAS